MGKYLYNYNETMRILGKQVAIAACDPVNEQINDVINAYYEVESESASKQIFELIKVGFLHSFIRNIYLLGVIHGKQMERKNKK